jgi:PAS domain S-box-containing protein
MSVEPRRPSLTGEFMIFTEDVSDDVRMRGLEATIRRRDAVLAAISHAASRFLDTADWDRDVHEVLARIGSAAEVSRVYLFEGMHNDRGVLCARMRHEWVAQGVVPRSGDPTMQDVEVGSVGVSDCEALERGAAINRSVASMLPGERDYFERLGIRSIAAVPIFAGAAWWGYLGLTDDTSDREWSSSVLEALRAAAATLGAAIYRKRADQTLRESEERFRHLSEAAFEGVLISDQGVMIEANPAIGRIFGYELDELRGKNLIDLVVAAESRDVILEHVRSGSEERYEVTGTRKDGTVIIAEVTGRATSYHGRPVRVTTINDVTERRRTEEELRTRGAQLAEAQAIAHLGSWDWDIATNHVTWSDEMYRVYGLEPHSIPITFESFLERVHPDDVALVRRTVEEVRHLRAEGRVVVDAAGRPARMVGTGQDVTERKEAETIARRLIEEQAARAAAEAAERRAAFLAEASRVLGTSFDYHTTLATLTRLAVPALADYCTVDILAHDGTVERVAIAHVDPAKEPPLWEVTRQIRAGAPMVEHLRSALFDGESVLLGEVTDAIVPATSVDEEHRHLLGELRPEALLCVPLRVSGVVVGALAMYTTEPGRRYGPEDLALAEELARRAALAVENARLFHEAELATRARDQMLGVVAHDLRNPLGTILMAAELVEEALAPESDARRKAAMIRRAGERMNRLIQDLLDVKRIDQGRLAVEPRPLQPITLLSEAVEMLRLLAAASSLELALDAAEDLPRVLADPMRIQQVLSNLIGNAIKFTPRGGRIAVRCSRATDDVRFAVTDTGPGIPAEQLPHVFGQFWQGTRSDRRGIGLGLAIAKGIVEAHHGRIWVESNVGAGSSFFFTLPIDH